MEAASVRYDVFRGGQKWAEESLDVRRRDSEWLVAARGRRRDSLDALLVQASIRADASIENVTIESSGGGARREGSYRWAADAWIGRAAFGAAPMEINWPMSGSLQPVFGLIASDWLLIRRLGLSPGEQKRSELLEISHDTLEMRPTYVMADHLGCSERPGGRLVERFRLTDAEGGISEVVAEPGGLILEKKDDQGMNWRRLESE